MGSFIFLISLSYFSFYLFPLYFIKTQSLLHNKKPANESIILYPWHHSSLRQTHHHNRKEEERKFIQSTALPQKANIQTQRTPAQVKKGLSLLGSWSRGLEQPMFWLNCHKTEHMTAASIFKDKQQKQIIYPAIHVHVAFQEPWMLHLTTKFRWQH